MPTPVRMVIVSVTVTPAHDYGAEDWLVNSLTEGQDDGRWSIETVPGYGPSSEVTHSNGRIAAMLHLARTRTEHRIARLANDRKVQEEMLAEIDDLDLRAYRAELRLIARG